MSKRTRTNVTSARSRRSVGVSALVCAWAAAVLASLADIPNVSSIVPAAGPSTGATAVTITGRHFTGATRVELNTTPTLTELIGTMEVDGEGTQITGLSVPAGVAVGLHGVVVTTPEGSSAVEDASFSVYTDTDLDRLPDDWELLIVDADPGDAITDIAHVDPAHDFDGDSEDNLTEYTNGTDPTDARSTHDPANAYTDFRFEIYRGADQTPARGFTLTFWGVELACHARPDETIASGTLTKPEATAGAQTVDLTVAPGGLSAGFGKADHADFGALMADFVDGDYRLELVADPAAGDPYSLWVTITVPAYDQYGFPDYVTPESPSAGATDVSVVPLLDFDTEEWRFAEVRDEIGTTRLYSHTRDAGDVPADQHRVPWTNALENDTPYQLLVGTHKWGSTWLGSRTRSTFTTADDALGAWVEMGEGSATGGGVSDNTGWSTCPSLALDSRDRPVVAWHDYAPGDRAVYIRRWNGASWDEWSVGSASGTGIAFGAGFPSVVVESSDLPVVAWQDYNGDLRDVYVRRWDGKAWVEVGAGSASGGGISGTGTTASELFLARRTDGTMVVAWRDLTTGTSAVYARQWDGEAWGEIGEHSASERGVSNSWNSAYCPTVAFGSEQEPILAWTDRTDARNWQVYVRHWSDEAWVEMGQGSASGRGISNTTPSAAESSTRPHISAGPDGMPVVAWDDDSSGAWQVYVRRWDGEQWVEMGQGSASGGGISNTTPTTQNVGTPVRLAVGPDGFPVVAWDDDSTGELEVYVRRWDGLGWAELGPEGASGGGVSKTPDERSDKSALAVDSRGSPVLAWQDAPEGVAQIYVRKWSGPNIALFDGFGDGDTAGWTAEDAAGMAATPPDVVASTHDYALRGTDSRGATWLRQGLDLGSVQELVVEMRAKAGPNTGDNASLLLLNTDDAYEFSVEGADAQHATLTASVGGGDATEHYPLHDRGHGWHDYRWTRDADGWWCLAIDDRVEALRFAQDSQLRSFDAVAVRLDGAQSEIEWLRVSATPLPGLTVVESTTLAAEEGGPQSVAVRLSTPSAHTVTVEYALTAGTATEGEDYAVAAATGTLTFVPGDTEQTIAVTLLDDADAEGLETIELTLSNPAHAVLDSSSSTQVTILDSESDSDNDGLNDAAEWAADTDWTDRDCDGDGMWDGWEAAHALDPLDASDAEEDADADGFTNLREQGGVSDPRDPQSVPEGRLVWTQRADAATWQLFYQSATAFPDGEAVGVGWFESDLTFAGTGQQGTTLSSAGGKDVFVVRYAADGRVRWARSIGGTDADISYSVAGPLADGGCILSGQFKQTVVFDTGDGPGTSVTALDGYDIFLARYTADGAVAWVRTAGSPSDDSVAVGVAPEGGVFATGCVGPEAMFQGGANADVTLAGDAGGMFAARYTADGDLLWVKPTGGDADDYGWATAPLPDGGVVVAGSFSNTVVFIDEARDDIALTATPSGQSDIVVARYAPDGALLWAVQAGGEGEDSAWAAAAMPDGSVVIAGPMAAPSAVFGAGEPKETVLRCAGATDAYLARLNADGTLAWARQAGGPGTDKGLEIAPCPDGGVVTAGLYRQTAVFGAGEARETVLTVSAWSDAFVARYGPEGNLIWALGIGGPSDQHAGAMSVGDEGSVWVMGRTTGDISLGVGEPNAVTHPYTSKSFLWLAKLALNTVADPEVGLDVDASTVTEDAGTVRLTVRLASVSHKTVTVEYDVSDGTALRDADYELQPGTLTFAPGETTKTIELTILDDDLVELPETIEVTLSNPLSSALPSDGSGRTVLVTIEANDEDPLPDAWEVQHFGNLDQGPTDDPDADGEDNLTESQNGTDPLDARSVNDPANAYADFTFEIYRGADQQADGSTADSLWGVQLQCNARDGETITSGALTKPDGTVGTQTLDLAVAENALSADLAEGQYASLTELTADYVSGDYHFHLVCDRGTRETVDLRFTVTVPAYTDSDFPAYVTIESPAAGVAGISVVPLLDLDTEDWSFTEVWDDAGDVRLYSHTRDAGDVPADQHRVPWTNALENATTYQLLVGTHDWGGTWLGSRTHSTFTTADDTLGAWVEMGEGSASEGGVTNASVQAGGPTIGMDADGRPIIAYNDWTTGNGEIHVLRWSGTAWGEMGENSAVGGGISNTATQSTSPQIASGIGSAPVVVWIDLNPADGRQEIYARRWDGTDWEELGAGSASLGGISGSPTPSVYPMCCLDSDGDPVAVWQDGYWPEPGTEIYARVWDGGGWVEMGTGSASAGGVSNSGPNSHAARVVSSRDGRVFVAWQDWSTGYGQVYVRAWTGSEWNEVGEDSASNGGISGSTAVSGNGLSMAADTDGYPVIVWQEELGDRREVYVLRWNGTDWVEMGEGSASSGGINRTSTDADAAPWTAIGDRGYPVTTWIDNSSGTHQVYVRRWNGLEWAEMGVGSASGGGISLRPGGPASQFMFEPAVIVLPGGDPAVTWPDQSSGIWQVCIRRWDGPNTYLFEGFGGGAFADWVVQDPFTSEATAAAPDVVASPTDYAVRGTGQGAPPDVENWLVHAVDMPNVDELVIELRARSGADEANSVSLFLIDGEDAYRFGITGGSEDQTQWGATVARAEQAHEHDLDGRAGEWHDYRWTRDADGWWSLAVDDRVELPNFAQDLQLKCFDTVAVQLCRDQSEIEWLRVSGNPNFPYVSFDSPVSAADETVGVLSIPVRLSEASTASVSVNYGITGGSATGGGVDYTLADGTLTFQPGETERTIDIDIGDDSLSEADETVEITLSAPTYSSLGPVTAHTATLHDEDADGDGMRDDWERGWFINLSHDGTADGDSDDLVDVDEFLAGTNPKDSDTDDDGMPDGWEVDKGLDPLVNDAGDDLDLDGLVNGDEYALGTGVDDRDTDEDGMRDGWEVANQFDPFTDDSAGDPDSDGFSNLLEHGGLSDPRNLESVPRGRLLWVRRSGGAEADTAYTVAPLAGGGAVLGGGFSGTATFASGATRDPTLTSAGGSDIFAAKYRADGTLAWAEGEGGTSGDEAWGVAALADGGALVTGLFRGSATFADGQPNKATLVSLGHSDAFVAKYAVDGTLTWVKGVFGTSYEWGRSIAALADGGALVTGTIRETVTFGEGEANKTVLTAVKGQDMFIARYDADGGLVWAKRVGGNNNDRGGGVAALPDGSALVTGQFAIRAVFGQGEARETTLQSTGTDVFLAKYEANGSLAWARATQGTGYHYGHNVVALPDGGALLTGHFLTTMVFVDEEGEETTLESAGGFDMFVARYDAEGEVLWATRIGGSGAEMSPDIAALPNGGALVTGQFQGRATFGPGDPGETVLTSAGEEDIFVAEYDADGRLLRASRTGGVSADIGSEVAVLPDGGVLVAGSFSDTVAFGQGEPNQTILASAGGSDSFLATYACNDVARPEVEFAVDAGSASEFVPAVNVAVRLSSVTHLTVAVDYAVTSAARSGAATGGGVDYTLTDGTFTFRPGESVKTIPITIESDALDETDETIEITLSTPQNGFLGPTSVHTFTIVDDDALPTVSFAAAQQAVDEDAGSATVSLGLSVVSGRDVVVPITVSGTASRPADHDLADGSVTIPAGSLSADTTVTIEDDALDEHNETIVVTLGDTDSATPGADTVHTISITDNDELPTVAFTLGEQDATERIGTAAVTVVLSAVSGRDVTVPYAVSGTAVFPDDHDLADGSFVVRAGDLSADLSIALIEDWVLEGEETVVLTMGEPVHAIVAEPDIHTVRIIPPAPPAVAILQPDGINDFPDEVGGFLVTWEAISDLPERTTISLYYSTSDAGYHPLDVIVSSRPFLLDMEYRASTTLWLRAEYYVWYVIDDGQNDPVTGRSEGRLIVPPPRSSITCELVPPQQLTFSWGQPVSVHALISHGTFADVQFWFTGPTPGTNPEGVPEEVHKTSRSVADYTQDGVTGSFAPPAVGDWHVLSYWAGNQNLSPAWSHDPNDPENRPKALTITQGTGELIIAGGSGTHYIQNPRDIAGQLRIAGGNAGVSLAGLLVHLTAQHEGARREIDLGDVPCTEYGHFVREGFAFDAPGVWTIEAAFAGSANLSAAEASVEIEVVSKPGYAIICQGKFGLFSDEGLAEHAKTLHDVYLAARTKGLSDEDIVYLTYDQAAEGRDETPTKDRLLNALKIWALARMNAAPAPLFVVLVNHGSVTTFHMGEHELTPAELGTALDDLQDGLAEAALRQPVVVVLGMCHSGSFIGALAREGRDRVLIASCDTREVSHRGPNVEGEVADGEYFVSALFAELQQGASVYEAFRSASASLRELTRAVSCNDAGADPSLPVSDDLEFSHRVLGFTHNPDATCTYRLETTAFDVPKPLEAIAFALPAADLDDLTWCSQRAREAQPLQDPPGLRFAIGADPLGGANGEDESEWFEFTVPTMLTSVTVTTEAADVRAPVSVDVPVNHAVRADDSPQHPLLDDNGDGQATHALSNPPDPGEDGELSSTVHLGVSENPGGGFHLTGVSASHFLAAGAAGAPEIRSTFSYRPTGMVSAWIEIKPPGYEPPSEELSYQHDMDLLRFTTTLAVDLTQRDPAGSRSRWQWLDGNPVDYVAAVFDEPGAYQVLHYGLAEDETRPGRQVTARGKVSWVFRADGGAVPEAFGLLAPADDETVSGPVLFDWQPSRSEAGRVRYLLRLWLDADATDVACESALREVSFAQLDHRSVTDGTYWWDVAAVDESGNVRVSAERRVLHLQNVNSPGDTNSCLIWGYVRDADSGETIPAAALEFGGGGSCQSASDGTYKFFGYQQTPYSMEASAEDYVTCTIDFRTPAQTVCRQDALLPFAGRGVVLSLHAGWNLFSLPVDPLEPVPEALLVDPASGERAYVGPIWGWQDDGYVRAGTLKPLSGYWAYCLQAVDVPVRGRLLGDCTVELHPGWNLTGAGVYHSVPRGISEVAVCGWDGVRFANVEEQAEPYRGKLRNTRAYWVHASKPMTIDLGPKGARE